jgi:hypothetical protein
MNNEKLVEENKSLKEQINEEINKQIKLLENKQKLNTSQSNSKKYYERTKEEIINIISKKCINNWCYTRITNNKYNGYCFNCFLKKTS